MFSSVTTEIYLSSASFAVLRMSSLLFTIRALIFLEGHRHEERTLLNISAMQRPGDFSLFQRHLTERGASKTIRDLTEKSVPPPSFIFTAQLTWPNLKQRPAHISVTLLMLC